MDQLGSIMNHFLAYFRNNSHPAGDGYRHVFSYASGPESVQVFYPSGLVGKELPKALFGRMVAQEIPFIPECAADNVRRIVADFTKAGAIYDKDSVADFLRAMHSFANPLPPARVRTRTVNPGSVALPNNPA